MDEKSRLEELQRKIEEIRQRTIADELVRLEAFATSHVTDLVTARRAEEELRFNHLLEEARRRRATEETALQSLEQEAARSLGAEIAKRAEARRAEQGELRRKAEEEARIRQETSRKKAEEEARLRAEAEQRKREEELRRQEQQRKKAEEEARLRAEAEQRKRKEEERQKAEAERRKKEEEQRRQQEAEQKRRQEEERARLEEEARKKLEEDLRRQQEEERLRKEAEERAKREEEERRLAQQAEEAREKERREREQRIRGHLSNAKAFFRDKKYQDASVEVAKALMNDPANAEALALDARIKEAEPAQDGAAPTDKPAKTQEGGKAKGQRPQKAKSPALLVVVIVAGALLVSAFLYFQLRTSVFTSSASIAILPWSGTAAGSDESFIGSSLAEEVVRQFERSPSVNVLGFSSAYGLVQRMSDPASSAFSLGYPFVLKGSVARSGDSYTFSLRLIDSTGGTAWEKSYTKSRDALMTLPPEIAVELRDVLRAADGGASPPARTPANGEAYLLYLKGIELLHDRSGDDLLNAHALFHQATALEAGFGEALAAKAAAIAMSFEAGAPLRGATLEEAKNLSAEAIALDQTMAAGYIARGMVYAQLKQYKMALQQFETALQHAPNSSEAQFNKAKIHLKVGQHEEGMNALTMAFRLNPRDPAILTLIAQTYQLARATQEGFWYHETAMHFVPDSTAYLAGPVADAILTDAALTLSQADRVQAALQRTVAAAPGDYRSLYRLARLNQVSGKGLEALTQLAAAENLLKQEIQSSPQNADALAYLALTLTRSGRFPEALVLAQKALDADPNSAEIKYRIAQTYSLQMYSGKTMTVDEELKERSSEMLKEALAIHYRFDELTNGDLYNMYEHSDFKSLMKVPLK